MLSVAFQEAYFISTTRKSLLDSFQGKSDWRVRSDMVIRFQHPKDESAVGLHLRRIASAGGDAVIFLLTPGQLEDFVIVRPRS